MNSEQKLEIKTNGEYKNIDIKSIENGNYVVIEKIFVEGMEKTGQYGKYYIVKAKYQDEEVSFFLNEKQHNEFKQCGGIGDNVKVTATLQENFKKRGTFYKVLSFDLL